MELNSLDVGFFDGAFPFLALIRVFSPRTLTIHFIRWKWLKLKGKHERTEQTNYLCKWNKIESHFEIRRG